MADEPQETPQDEPAPEEPTAEQPAAEEPEATPEQPEAAAEQADEPAAEQADEPEAPAEETPAAESDEPADAEAAPAETSAEPEAEAAAEPEAGEAPAEKPKPKRKKDAKADEPEVIPGAHLEPDLVLEEEKKSRAEESGYVGAEVEVVDAATEGETPAAEESDEAPAPLEAVLNLAADARYRATGKRKSAVARVTLKPGTGEYTINGKPLDVYFPRASLQTKARLPLVTVGQQERMDVVAKIHGGGVSAQAGALRHGITRALVEADPNLRGELKRRGFLTRDPRVKERKKAGLKKARKRPQFSKR
jgi:small subunit ribosomal protein S9